MVIKDFEERNYMKYPVYDYKYFKLFEIGKEYDGIQSKIIDKTPLPIITAT